MFYGGCTAKSLNPVLFCHTGKHNHLHGTNVVVPLYDCVCVKTGRTFLSLKPEIVNCFVEDVSTLIKRTRYVSFESAYVQIFPATPSVLFGSLVLTVISVTSFSGVTVKKSCC